jgi:hypothetical protein
MMLCPIFIDRSLDTQATRSVEMDTGHPSVCDFLIKNSDDIAMVLKKSLTADPELSCYSGMYCSLVLCIRAAGQCS